MPKRKYKKYLEPGSVSIIPAKTKQRLEKMAFEAGDPSWAKTSHSYQTPADMAEAITGTSKALLLADQIYSDESSLEVESTSKTNITCSYSCQAKTDISDALFQLNELASDSEVESIMETNTALLVTDQTCSDTDESFWI
ncbi:uncharacterized protein [Chanodichthys erythropterus]|uniref:uncharacterized protein isoform X3 n=1 Tax=Chanodichthys erythropterus TaxID=933992 RepID=UPI00351E717B